MVVHTCNPSVWESGRRTSGDGRLKARACKMSCLQAWIWSLGPIRWEEHRLSHTLSSAFQRHVLACALCQTSVQGTKEVDFYFKFKASLNYIASLRPAWTIWDSVIKRKERKKGKKENKEKVGGKDREERGEWEEERERQERNTLLIDVSW